MVFSKGFDENRHILSREENAKGGSVVSLSRKLSRRKYCNSSCPIFDRCPFVGLGLRYNTCFLNKDNPILRRSVLKLLNGNSEDFFDVISMVISFMIRIIVTEDKVNVKTLKFVFDALKDFYVIRFGSRNRIVSDGKIDINIFKKYLRGEVDGELGIGEINVFDKR